MGYLDAVLGRTADNAPANKPRKLTTMARREAWVGFAFISPWILGFLLFYLIPMGASLWFSTLNFQLSTPGEVQYIGSANWERMLFSDPNVWQSLAVTLRFLGIALPIGMIAPIALAILLNSEYLIGKNIFRTLFYAPAMIPAIAGVLIWSQVLNPQTGWINRIIQFTTGYGAVGLDGLRWLDDPSLVYFAYVFIGLWGMGNAILVTLASLQGVPTELYEASEIDGAGWWRKLWNITLPLISPVLFYNLVLSVVGLLQYFLTPYVLNGGSGYPQNSTLFYMIYFYKQAFGFANMGYGATLAWFMFLIALVITLVLFGTARFWVYYAADQQ